MSKDSKFFIGDPVWAKMKGFSAWPGKLDIPPDRMKRPAMKKMMHCVFFFGSHDYAWIVDTDLKPYNEFKNTLTASRKSGTFKKAIDEIEEYIALGKPQSYLKEERKAFSQGGVGSGFDITQHKEQTNSSNKSSKKRNSSLSSNNVSNLDADTDAEFDALFSDSSVSAVPSKSGARKSNGVSKNGRSSNESTGCNAKKQRLSRNLVREKKQNNISSTGNNQDDPSDVKKSNRDEYELDDKFLTDSDLESNISTTSVLTGMTKVRSSSTMIRSQLNGSSSALVSNFLDRPSPLLQRPISPSLTDWTREESGGEGGRRTVKSEGDNTEGDFNGSQRNEDCDEAGQLTSGKCRTLSGASSDCGSSDAHLLENNNSSLNGSAVALTTRPEQEVVITKSIKPSPLNFGFLGLGIMGSRIVKNLLNSGHKVTIWNRTVEKTYDLSKIGAKSALTPGDVIAESDVTFSCVSDPQAAKDMVFGNCGVLNEITRNKGYVEMTGIDTETSQDIAEAISLKGGRYLEAQIQGSKSECEKGTLVVLVAGDRSLFNECQSCFQAMASHSFFLGSEVGTAPKMNLVLQLIAGVSLSALAEGMALADRAGLQQKDLLKILKLTSTACPLILEKGKAIVDGTFPPHQPLTHMQKDLKLALNMADQLEQPLPLTAAANEIFKHAKRLGYADHDTSAVYIRARF